MQGSGTILILRFIHVVGGAFWFGAVIFMTGFLMPSLQSAGPAGGAVMDQLTRVRRVPMYMMGAAILTVLSGLSLYARDSDGFSGAWMRSGTGMVFGIGGTAGILAAIVGMVIAAPAGKRMAALGVARSRRAVRLRPLIRSPKCRPFSPASHVALRRWQC